MPGCRPCGSGACKPRSSAAAKPKPKKTTQSKASKPAATKRPAAKKTENCAGCRCGCGPTKSKARRPSRYISESEESSSCSDTDLSSCCTSDECFDSYCDSSSEDERCDCRYYLRRKCQ